MSMENICTIIIAVLSSMLTSIIAIKISKKQYIGENRKQDIQKAIDMARLYEKEVLPLINGLNPVYKKLNKHRQLMPIIDRTRKISALQFTKEEAERLFGKEDLQEVCDEIYIHNIPKELLLESRTALSRNLLNDAIFLASIKNDEDRPDNFDSIFLMQLRLEFSEAKMKLLNKLESFSMYFTNGIADEEIVYQSLHQTYIEVVGMLYFDISKSNTDPKEMYFVNIIDLYNKWNKRYREKRAKEAAVNNIARQELTEMPKKYM